MNGSQSLGLTRIKMFDEYLLSISLGLSCAVLLDLSKLLS